MTPDTDDPAPGDRDLDAAEYVLGLLPPERARAVEALAAHDPAVAASIVAWQNRLSPLANVVVPEFPPPELWQRLALASGLQKAFVRRNAPRRSIYEKIWRSSTLWQATTLGATAVAASLAFLLLSAKPPPEPLLAALSPQHSPGAVFLVRVGERGQATIIAVGRPTTPINRSLELWALGGGGHRAREPRPAAGRWADPAEGARQRRDAVAGQPRANRRVAHRRADWPGGLFRSADRRLTARSRAPRLDPGSSGPWTRETACDSPRAP